MMMVVVEGGDGQIDLFRSFVRCDGTNEMHKLKIADKLYWSWIEIYLPQFDAKRQSLQKEKEDEVDGIAEKTRNRKWIDKCPMKSQKNFHLCKIGHQFRWIELNSHFICLLSLFLSPSLFGASSPLLPVLFCEFLSLSRSLLDAYSQSTIRTNIYTSQWAHYKRWPVVHHNLKNMNKHPRTHTRTHPHTCTLVARRSDRERGTYARAHTYMQ